MNARLLETLVRCRAYVVVVATVLIVTLLAPTGDGGSPSEVQADLGGPAPGGPLPAGDGASAGQPGVITAPEEAPASGAPAGGTPSSAAGGRRSTGPARARGAAPVAAPGAPRPTVPRAAGSFPGVGTPEAMANPDCDPKTGRIRFPSTYAPQCVAPWPAGADNGGATAQGVTAEAVRLVYYYPQNTRDEENVKRDFLDYVNIYNKHFEFWGRKIEVVFVRSSGSGEVAERADATHVATTIKPFFSTTGSTTFETYSRELAARGVITFDYNASWKDSQTQAPYRWSVNTDDRTTVLHAMEYAGKRLAGRPTKWAGDAATNGTPRVFGLVHPTVWDLPFAREEAKRNAVALRRSVSYDQGDTASAQEAARTAVARLKSEGVTTVINGGDYLFNIILTKAATSQLFFPEWMLTGWNLQDVVIFARLNDQQQWAHAFGPTPLQVLTSQSAKESGNGPGSVWHWQYGSNAPRTSGAGAFYTALQFGLVQCLQLAGPRLTPESFRDGCFAFTPAGGVHCGCTATIGMSFGRRPGTPWISYSSWDDMSEKWWDPNQNGPDEADLSQVGGYYMRVDGGRRYRAGEWPATEPRVFDPNGTVTIYDGYPPSEAPPQYPNDNPG